MRKLNYLAAITLLYAVSMVSCTVGRQHKACCCNYNNLFEEYQKLKKEYQKTYNDACRMADVIRCYNDHLEVDSIEDYGCFEEIKSVYLYDDALGDTIKLEDYVYGY